MILPCAATSWAILLIAGSSLGFEPGWWPSSFLATGWPAPASLCSAPPRPRLRSTCWDCRQASSATKRPAGSGRARYVTLVMMASGSLAWLAGFSSAWHWWITILILAIYNVSIMADSAALTAGLVTATPAANRGSAMAVYSFLGFGGGFAAPMVFGAVLDLAGGKANSPAWGFAFASLGAGCLILSLLARFKKPPLVKWEFYISSE